MLKKAASAHLPMSISSISSKFNPSMDNVKVRSLPNRKISLSADVSLAIPIPVTADIGFFGVDAAINNAPIFQLSVSGIKLLEGERKTFRLSADIEFLDDERTPEEISRLVDDITSPSPKLDQRLTLTNLYLGNSPKTFIDAFSDIEIRPILNTVISGQIDLREFISRKLKPSITAKDGVVDLNLTPTVGATVHQANVEFLPSKTIGVGTTLVLKVPFAAHIDVPQFEITLDLDNVPGITIRVLGVLAVTGKGSTVKVLVKVHDSQHLAVKVKTIVDVFMKSTAIPGTLAVGGIYFGHSTNDRIATFGTMSIPILLDSVMKPLSNALQVNLPVLIASLDLKVKDAEMTTLGGRAVETEVSAAWSKAFPISMKLDHVFLNIGIDDIDMMKVQASVELDDNVSLKARIVFSSGENEQNKVAAFIDDIQHMGSKTALTCTNLSLGKSEADNIQFFSKLNFDMGFATVLKSVLGAVGMERSDLSPEALLNRLVIRRANVDMGQLEKMLIDAKIAVKDTAPLALKANVGYIDLMLSLKEQPFANVVIPRMLIKSEGDDIVTDFHADMNPRDRPELRTLVGDLMAEGDVLPALAFSGIKFGTGSDSEIDLFAKATFIIDIEPYRQYLLSYIDKHFGVDVRDVSVGLRDHESMDAKMDVKIKGIPSGISMQIPFVAMEVTYNGMPMVTTEIKNFLFDDGSFKCDVLIQYHRDDRLWAHVGGIFSDFLFHREISALDSIAFKKLEFGMARGNAFSFLKDALVSISLVGMINDVQGYFNSLPHPFNLLDIHANMEPDGFTAVVKTSRVRFGEGDLPLSFRVPSMSQELFHRDSSIGTFFIKPSLVKGEPIVLDMQFKVTPPAIGNALNELLPELLAWKSYTQHVTIGGPVFYMEPDSMTAKRDAAFTFLKGMRIITPDLYIWPNVDLCNLRPIWYRPNSWTVTVSVPINLSPIRTQIDSVRITILHNDKKVFIIRSLGGIVMESEDRGGFFGIDMEMTLMMNPLTHWSMFADLIRGRLTPRISFDLVHQGKKLKWLNEAFENAPIPIARNLLTIGLNLWRNLGIKIPVVSDAAKYLIGRFKKTATLTDACQSVADWRKQQRIGQIEGS